VVLKRGIRPSEKLEQEFRGLVVAAWPELEYKHLGAVEFASELPRSATGKLQRSRLKPSTLTEYSYEC
jgi:acyl-coenzyme A synthetase/AMP-(fatty) acid ligase